MDELRYFGDELLEGELRRRAAARGQGVCDYCGKPGSEPSCSRPHRHAAAAAAAEGAAPKTPLYEHGESHLGKKADRGHHGRDRGRDAGQAGDQAVAGDEPKKH